MGNMEERSAEVIVVESVQRNEVEKSSNVSTYRQQKAASSGLGFLLQQMRASATASSAVTTNQEEEPANEEDVAAQPKARKTPIRPTAAEYSLLSNACGGEIELKPVQIVQDCYNQGTTPKFDFAKECSENNFVRSCKFSPTGNHLITDSVDRRVRVFAFEDDKLSLKKSILNGDLIYDLVWDPFGENFATTSGGSPIKLWSCDGEQGISYHGINHMDELDFAHSIAFDLSGEKLYGTYRGVVRRFDISRPGRQISEMKTYDSLQSGQRSILSCIEMSPAMQGVYAIGSFGSGVGLYSDYTNSCDMLIPTQARFVTCLGYSSDGQQLFVGGRKSPTIECYDVRNLARLLGQYSRPVTNGQRVYFKVDPANRFLFSGSSNGDIRIFDLKNLLTDNSIVEPAWTITNVSKAATTGLDLHPSEPLVVTTHGQRVFPMPLDDEADEVEMQDENNYLQFTKDFDNSLKLWRF